ncbi:Mor transcription activator family protein [Bosea sp. (in: a-proteobacteria)]|jgi:Mor family transcriptional regulator|uniref:Mor transcription activator family protein n=1 Tax=Bosea sp. (in: a-proteobacteria) TaxID=1871050 RepID=UPI003568D301
MIAKPAETGHPVEIRTQDIAESIRTVAAQFGVEAAVAMIEAFGGTEIYIPETWREGHPLNVVGQELAQALCNLIGGATVAIPKELITSQARHQRAIELAGEGRKTAEIARALNLTERHVYKLLRSEPVGKRRARRPVDPRQISFLDD